MSQDVVVRFAPSPTGPLHIGGVRTALYNYLFAKKHGGRFILRIEDTDQARYVPGAEDYIIQGLSWIGIHFNEGVGIGGDAAPYRQSERKEIYRKYADQLLESGHAYIAFDTSEEIDAMRARLEKAGQHQLHYNHKSRQEMKNSFTLSKEEVEKRVEAGDPYVVRMNMPANEDVRFKDIVRDWVVFNTSQLDDKILLKSDGMPTYHLANVVDDHLMEITHVIRGEEWLSSTPLHVLLYRAFGWEDTMPQFVHLPLLLNPNAKGKMSKRQGDKLGFSVFPLEWKDPKSGEISSGYREDGYLPDAMMNFLALLGWSPGNDEEIMTEERLVELFSLERINSSGTKFDLDKLKWFNQNYMRQKTVEELLPLVKEVLSNANITVEDDEKVKQVISLLQERVTILPDFAEQSRYFFETPATYNEKMLKKHWKGRAKELIQGLKAKFEAVEDWRSENLHDSFQQLLAEEEVGTGKVMAPMRLALTGVPAGPGAFDIAEVLGREETLARFDKVIEELPI